MIETEDERRYPNEPRHRPDPDQWTAVHEPAQSGRLM